MKPFLSQVAGYYYSKGDISSRCFLFPNRRSLAFFRRYLSEEVRNSGQALMCPEMMTVDDFFTKAAGKRKADRIKLLLELYECYKPLNPKHESLDDFLYWGEVILSDFNDVDKYLVDPEKLFRNVADFKNLQDGLEHLSDNQREAIESFLKHFRTGGDIKENFMQMWNILLPLYHGFMSRLSENGLSYEGMIYRSLAQRLTKESAVDVFAEYFPEVTSFVFVGLNQPNECEKAVMRKLRDAGLAEFCWDYSSDMIKNPDNRSSFFMEKNVSEFPSGDFRLDDDPTSRPQVNVLSVPSSVGQAKQLSGIIGEAPGMDTAIVLPDENLLLPVLNSLPETVRDINVTMGYPAKSSELFSLLSELQALQMHMRQKEGKWYFYHKQVNAIFSNSVFKSIATESDKEKIAAVKVSGRYYVPQTDLSGTDLLDLLFKPVVYDVAASDSTQTAESGKYLSEAIRIVALKLKDMPQMSLEVDFAKVCYQTLERLSAYDLELLPATYFRLLGGLLSSETVPFNGEPLKGLQIMGPLETRCLDFKKLIILSCNEGMFPRHSVSVSFIPPELRRGFDLPTYEYQDAVWAYYFYRMIQRAETLWMLYDSRTEGLHSGEVSRYVKQLELHFGLSVNHYVAKAPIKVNSSEKFIPKTDEDIRQIKERYLSASALQNYLDCGAKFYYSFLKKLKAEDEVAEFLDAGMIGSVFHETLQKLYSREDHRVSRQYLQSLISSPDIIRGEVRQRILEKMKAFEISGRNLVFEQMIFSFVNKVIERDLELLDNRGKDHFEILGLERTELLDYRGLHFKGIIDRLDCLGAAEMRVVDYKTGKVEDEVMKITDANAEKIVAALFKEDNEKRPKVALQIYLYDLILRASGKYADVRLFNSIYQTSKLFVSEVITEAENERFDALMDERFDALIDELLNPEVPFRLTGKVSICKYCDFKTICGR